MADADQMSFKLNLAFRPQTWWSGQIEAPCVVRFWNNTRNKSKPVANCIRQMFVCPFQTGGNQISVQFHRIDGDASLQRAKLRVNPRGIGLFAAVNQARPRAALEYSIGTSAAIPHVNGISHAGMVSTQGTWRLTTIICPQRRALQFLG